MTDATCSAVYLLLEVLIKALHDTVSERLRRWTRNPLGSARRGSNLLGVALSIGNAGSGNVQALHKVHLRPIATLAVSHQTILAACGQGLSDWTRAGVRCDLLSVSLHNS